MIPASGKRYTRCVLRSIDTVAVPAACAPPMLSALRCAQILKSGKTWAKSPYAHTSCTCKYKGTLTPGNGGKQAGASRLTDRH